MTNAEAITQLVTVAIALIALGSLGLLWVKRRELKLITKVLFLVFGLCVTAGVLMLLLLVLPFPSV